MSARDKRARRRRAQDRARDSRARAQGRTQQRGEREWAPALDGAATAPTAIPTAASGAVPTAGPGVVATAASADTATGALACAPTPAPTAESTPATAEPTPASVALSAAASTAEPAIAPTAADVPAPTVVEASAPTVVEASAPAALDAPSPAVLDAPSRPIPVVWEGSQFVYHSLAHVNRELCVRLAHSAVVDLSVLPFEQHQFSATDQPRFAPVERRLRKPLGAPAAVHVRHQWPPRFEAPQHGAWVMIQPWEFGGLPAEWVGPMRDEVDEIWVPSTWVRECYIRSGVPGDKVKVVPNGVRAETYRPDGPVFPLKTKKSFKFLFLGGTIGRKGIDLLLKTYFSTFTAQDDVCLVIKATGTNGVYAGSSIEELLRQVAQIPNAAATEYIAEDLTDEQVAALYRACDALVHPYRGEGFGMPIAEAMATGLPVIVTEYGACLDFCDADSAFLIPATAVPVSETAGLPPTSIGYWWAEPNAAALANLMRRVARDPKHAREVGRRGRERILSFTWQRSADLVVERITELSTRTPLRLRESATTFSHGVAPLPLAGRRGTAFLHHPDWSQDDWQEVVTSFGRAFTPKDDAMLVLCLDPQPGLDVATASARVEDALVAAGLHVDELPDMLLVPDRLDVPDLARLYAAADWVVPVGDAVQAQRARRSGARVLNDLTPAGWRWAAGALAHEEAGGLRPPLRKALCSFAVGSHVELQRIARETLETYAQRHGYDLHLVDRSPAPERPASWSKIPLVRELLTDYDVVFWVDADAIIVDPSVDVASVIEPGKFLYIVEHTIGPQHIPNMGVFLVQAGEPTQRLFDEVWRKAEFTNHPWWEQAAVLQLLGYNLHPCGLRQPTALYRRVKFIDRAWNSVPLDASPAPFVKHYAGVPHAERLALMRQDLRRFRASSLGRAA